MARHVQIHTTFLTHVLRGRSDLSADQCLKVATYFGFSPLETDFFFNLVQFNRASDPHTLDYFRVKVNELRGKGFELKEQLHKKTEMSPNDQAIFYSDWIYSAIRLSTALPEGGSADHIAKLLGLPVDRVAKAVDFLLGCGLCAIDDGRLTYGVFSTYVDSGSPFAKKLHENWRLRSIQSGASDAGEDLMYTSAVTLTKADFLVLRDVLLATLKQFEKVTDDSEPRLLAYLALDWIRLTR